jgi:hypothetical protein
MKNIYTIFIPTTAAPGKHSKAMPPKDIVTWKPTAYRSKNVDGF